MLKNLKPLLTLLFCLIVAGAFAAAMSLWAQKRFESRVVPGLAPVPTHREPLAERVVLFLFDDVSYDTALRNLPLLRDKARKDGFVSKVMLDDYTFTVAGVYTIGTGDQPSLLQVMDNYFTQEVVANNIFENVRSIGGKTYYIGESLWLDMYGRGLTAHFTSRNLGPNVDEGSDLMIQRLESVLKAGDHALIVVHLGETGRLSHKEGVHGEKLAAVMRGLDRKVFDLSEEHGEGVAWLVGSDHGTTEQGQHGGRSRDERSSILMGFGPGLRRGVEASFSQVDVANAVEFLLGAPFPSQSCGVLPDIFEEGDGSRRTAATAELIRQKRNLYDALKLRFDDMGSVDPNDLLSLKRGVERAKLRLSDPLSFAGYIAVLLAIVALAAAPIVIRAVSAAERSPWRPAAIAALSCAAFTAALYLFPSMIYLGQTEAVRYVYLFTVVGAALVFYLAYALAAAGANSRTADLVAIIGWGAGAAFVIAVPGRYYSYVIPSGFVILANLRSLVEARGGRDFLARFAKRLPLVLVVLFATLYQIPDLHWAFAKKVAVFLKESSWWAELALAPVLVALGLLLNLHYKGAKTALQRWLSLALIYGLHAFYNLGVTDSNAVLGALYLFAFAWLFWTAKTDGAQGRRHWHVLLVLAVMTQQQSASEMAFILVCSALFRWLYTANPYRGDRLRHDLYTAFSLVVFSVFVLTARGHLFFVSHIMTLKGFLGCNMPVFMPANVALVCFYYLQPILISWFVVRATTDGAQPFYRPGVIAAALLLAEATCTASLFSFSVIPGDDYFKSAVGSALLLNTAFGFLIAAGASRYMQLRGSAAMSKPDPGRATQGEARAGA